MNNPRKLSHPLKGETESEERASTPTQSAARRLKCFPSPPVGFALHASHSFCAQSPLELATSSGVRSESVPFIKQSEQDILNRHLKVLHFCQEVVIRTMTNILRPDLKKATEVVRVNFQCSCHLSLMVLWDSNSSPGLGRLLIAT